MSDSELFKEGWNSVYRLTFGIFSALSPAILLPLYIGQQVFIDKENTAIKIQEVLIGYLIGSVMLAFFKIMKFVCII